MDDDFATLKYRTVLPSEIARASGGARSHRAADFDAVNVGSDDLASAAVVAGELAPESLLTLHDGTDDDVVTPADGTSVVFTLDLTQDPAGQDLYYVFVTSEDAGQCYDVDVKRVGDDRFIGLERVREPPPTSGGDLSVLVSAFGERMARGVAEVRVTFRQCDGFAAGNYREIDIFTHDACHTRCTIREDGPEFNGVHEPGTYTYTLELSPRGSEREREDYIYVPERTMSRRLVSGDEEVPIFVGAFVLTARCERFGLVHQAESCSTLGDVPPDDLRVVIGDNGSNRLPLAYERDPGLGVVNLLSPSQGIADIGATNVAAAEVLIDGDVEGAEYRSEIGDEVSAIFDTAVSPEGFDIYGIFAISADDEAGQLNQFYAVDFRRVGEGFSSLTGQPMAFSSDEFEGELRSEVLPGEARGHPLISRAEEVVLTFAAETAYRELVIFGLPHGTAEFLRGDTNSDRAFHVSDPITILFYLFADARLDCDDAADANDDGVIDVSDAVFLLNSLFSSGASIAEPFPDCGWDWTPDDLLCASSACSSS